MVKKASELNVVVNEKMRGGEGTVAMEHLVDAAHMYDKNRLFGRIIIKPGCSIGYHVHENEMEAYYIISGKGLYDDNGTQTEVFPGDVTITLHGEGHGIVNNGDEDLIFIALVPLK